MPRLIPFALLIFLSLGSSQAGRDLERIHIFSELYKEHENPPQELVGKMSGIPDEKFILDLNQSIQIHANLFRLVNSLSAQMNSVHNSYVYTTEEEDELRGTWLEILNYRSIILRMIARHQNYSR